MQRTLLFILHGNFGQWAVDLLWCDQNWEFRLASAERYQFHQKLKRRVTQILINVHLFRRLLEDIIKSDLSSTPWSSSNITYTADRGQGFDLEVTVFSKTTMGVFFLERPMSSLRGNVTGSKISPQHVAKTGRQMNCGNALICGLYALLDVTVRRRTIQDLLKK